MATNPLLLAGPGAAAGFLVGGPVGAAVGAGVGLALALMGKDTAPATTFRAGTGTGTGGGGAGGGGYQAAAPNVSDEQLAEDGLTREDVILAADEAGVDPHTVDKDKTGVYSGQDAEGYKTIILEVGPRDFTAAMDVTYTVPREQEERRRKENEAVSDQTFDQTYESCRAYGGKHSDCVTHVHTHSYEFCRYGPEGLSDDFCRDKPLDAQMDKFTAWDAKVNGVCYAHDHCLPGFFCDGGVCTKYDSKTPCDDTETVWAYNGMPCPAPPEPPPPPPEPTPLTGMDALSMLRETGVYDALGVASVSAAVEAAVESRLGASAYGIGSRIAGFRGVMTTQGVMPPRAAPRTLGRSAAGRGRGLALSPIASYLVQGGRYGR